MRASSPAPRNQRKQQQHPRHQGKRDNVADQARRDNGRNSKGFANPSPQQVHIKREERLDWQNSELCSPTGISITPTTAVGDILFQTPLRVDAYPGSLLEREMVQWERWRMREWGFSFGTLKSKMEPGAVIVFWEPDPKIVHTSSPQLATYAYAHSNKLKISAFENRVFTIRPTPGDKTERYCLNKGSDERLTTYGTMYVVYLGGAKVTAPDVFWTLEHHQKMDWMMRDIDPVGTANAQNEGTTNSPPVNDLLAGMTFTPGGVDPQLESSLNGTDIVFNPAQVGSANNILITAVTQLTSNAGVQIPFETSATIQGIVHDVNEAMDHVDPETSAEMVSQYICGGNQICRIALKGATTALVAFAVQRVKLYINTLPGNITSMSDPALGRYQPPQVAQIFRSRAERSHSKLQTIQASTGETSSILYSSIDVESLIDAVPGDKQHQNITTFMGSHEYVNTGITPTFTATVTPYGSENYLAELEMRLKGAAVGDTFLLFMKAQSPVNPDGGTTQNPAILGLNPNLNRWWNDPEKGTTYFVGGNVSNPADIRVIISTTPGTAWSTYGQVGHFELELHYATSLPALVKGLKGRLPITFDHTGEALAIDRFASSGSIAAWNTFTVGAPGFRDIIWQQYSNNAQAKVSGFLLDHGTVSSQSYSSLRSIPSGMTGWLHFHFYVTHDIDYPGGIWEAFAVQGSRSTVPLVNEAITIGPRDAIYMFKMLVPTGSGETGIRWNGNFLQSGSYAVANFFCGFTQIESEADEKLNSFRKLYKEKLTKKNWTHL